MRLRKLSSLSLFFPAYNEEGNIATAISQALAVLPKIAHRYEVVVVNDGSKDRTKMIALDLAAHNRHVRVVSQRNKGYGGALKKGFSESSFDWIFFTDADLQFDLQEIRKLAEKTTDTDMVLGYRLHRADGWKRMVLARLLKWWNYIWFGFPREIWDTDCAFKLIRRDVIRTIEPFISDGAMISTELILKARAAGYGWKQVGVHHFQRMSGKPTGSNLKVIWRAIKDTMMLWRNFWQENRRVVSTTMR